MLRLEYNRFDMKFAAVIEYGSDLSKLQEVRPAHREYLGMLRDTGKLAISGPYTDGPGALIVLECETKEQVDEIISGDPLTKAGIFKSWTVRQWNPVFINRSLLPE
jgi:uncharacterized protein